MFSDASTFARVQRCHESYGYGTSCSRKEAPGVQLYKVVCTANIEGVCVYVLQELAAGNGAPAFRAAPGAVRLSQ